MLEQWCRWEPIDGLSKKYDLVEISDNFEELRIVLFSVCGESNKVQITFNNSVHAYRNIYETFLIKDFEKLCRQYGSEFFANWTFFKVNNSEYMTLLLQNLVSIQLKAFMHFSLNTANFVIDIIADIEPKVEFIEN